MRMNGIREKRNFKCVFGLRVNAEEKCRNFDSAQEKVSYLIHMTLHIIIFREFFSATKYNRRKKKSPSAKKIVVVFTTFNSIAQINEVIKP